MATVKAFIRTDKPNKSGTCPIKIRITENRKSREKSIGQRVNPRFWNEDLCRVKPNHPESNRLN